MDVRRDATDGALRLSGRLDRHSVADVRQALHAAVDAGSGDLVVDLADLEVSDASGLGLLVSAHRRAGRLGRRVVLRNAPPPVLRLLTATKLHRILTVDSQRVCA